MATELKPCPFCGAEGLVPRDEGDTHCGVWFLTCQVCHAQGPCAITASRAIDAWNNRCDNEAADIIRHYLECLEADRDVETAHLFAPSQRKKDTVGNLVCEHEDITEHALEEMRGVARWTK